MKHTKHAAIARPAYGTFSRYEWAIIGTPCGQIHQLVDQLIPALSENWKVGYVDADHKESELAGTAVIKYTDKISHHRLESREKWDAFQFRPLFNGMDAVIVNGNHCKAKHQVVVIDPKKEESLSRKLDRLTDVQLILLTEGMSEPYDFLQKQLSNIGEIPILHFSDTSGIIEFFKNKLTESVPSINGLVLAGGKSQRMGQDKGLLEYHGVPQRQYVADLVNPFCKNTYLSCRPDQVGELAGTYPSLPDTFTGLGPMGAILSAFREQPDVAWLVVACDLPLLDQATLDFLVKNRNPSEMATTFRSPVNEFPEPLVTIWEPRSYPVLLQFLAQGYSCPRKALINSSIELLEVPDREALKNVNTPEELEEIFSKING